MITYDYRFKVQKHRHQRKKTRMQSHPHIIEKKGQSKIIRSAKNSIQELKNDKK